MNMLIPIDNPFRIRAPRAGYAVRSDQTPPTLAAQCGNRNRESTRHGALLDSSRTMAGMLLAAVLASVLVVAEQLIETWADGHLLAVWVTLWVLTFAALSLLASPLRQLSASLANLLQRRSAGRAEEDMSRLASRDYRLMDEWVAARQGTQHELE